MRWTSNKSGIRDRKRTKFFFVLFFLLFFSLTSFLFRYKKTTYKAFYHLFSFTLTIFDGVSEVQVPHLGGPSFKKNKKNTCCCCCLKHNVILRMIKLIFDSWFHKKLHTLLLFISNQIFPS